MNLTKYSGHYWRKAGSGYNDPFHTPYASRKTLRTLPEPKPPPKPRDKDRPPQAQEIKKQQQEIAANHAAYVAFMHNQNKYLRVLDQTTTKETHHEPQ